MKVYFYISDLHKYFNKLNVKYNKINISNTDIIRFLKIFYNNKKLNLSNETTVDNFMKNYSINSKYLLIQLENYEKVFEFKKILSSKYNEIIIIKENEELIEKSSVLTQIQMKIENMIVIERIENITEKESIFEKLLNIKIDNVYCLTYKNSNDNKNKILIQLNKMNSSIEFVNIKNKEKYDNEKLDLYKYCISDAKLKNYENIIIMTEDNEYNYNNFMNFLNKKCDFTDYDLLFLSGKLLDGEIYKENLIKTKTIQDSSCFIVNSKVYDYIIDNINKNWDSIDNWNQRTKNEKQINWNKKVFENFITKYVCQKRDKSYFISPLIAYKADSIDKENRIVTYQDVMNKLCIINSLKYRVDFDVFVISTEKNPRNIMLFVKNQVFSNFNIFQKIVKYDFDKDDKLSLFNLYPLKTDKQHHNYDKNVMQDFLNHYFLWEYFASVDENKLHFICYDNIEMVDNFKYKLNDLLKEIPKDTEFVVLNDEFYNSGYLISNNGCKKMIRYLKENSVQTNVNDFLLGFNNLNFYKKENLVKFNYKIEKDNSLGTMEQINKRLNPNLEKYTDDIKDDKIMESNDFKDKISDNYYKEVLLNNITFYKNSKGLLFKFHNNILEYYGYLENNNVVVHSLHKSLFGLQLNKKDMNNKETIMFYQEIEDVPFYLRKILDLVSLKYNVVFMGKNFYNVKLNNITYIRNNKDDDLILKIQKLYSIKKFYTNTPNLLLKVLKKEDIEMNFIYHKFYYDISFNSKMFKNNGIDFLKNTIEKFDNVYFFTKDKMNELKSTLNLNHMPENFKLNSFAVSKNNKNKLGEKENIILSFDKHPKKIINSFKLINKKLEDKFKLVILNNNINIEEENVIILPFDDNTYLKLLKKSYFFMTFENTDDTYYHILNAINSYCIPIIPNYFVEFKNKFIGVNNFINKHNLDDIKEIYSNNRKKIIYNNLCDSIIKNHINNMNY